MKFFLVLVILSLASLAVVQGLRPCPTDCNNLWNPVCADNGRCTALFGNPCKYDRWNCNTIGREQYIVLQSDQKCKALGLDSYNSIICR